ncbi:hypothetical protein E4U43_001308 [Claviceps pusilla]|uniref:Uncharacterized protein n=1 Tax=Claviceps pusilla TaxID=123648 RepID=A0A9P7SWY8_9HYPO|nr:hypothetical protein E4U43_001308 [Claviceps pusilla]
MQAVPSLVGTGTAIAAAASGLVFGQPINQSHNSDHHEIQTTARAKARGHKKTISIDQVLPLRTSRISILPSRRPATSSAATSSIGPELHALAGSPRQTSRPPLSRRHRPQNTQVSPPPSSGRHHLPLPGDPWNLLPSAAVKEEPKDSSLPGANSWFRRLSLRPLSQHGSLESSILADSVSFTISHGSAAPMLSRPVSASKPSSPNKLVKRSFPKLKQPEHGPNRKSKGHLPGLRRPATSHQRSATLQQFRADIDVAYLSPHPKYSFDEPVSPEELLGASPIEDVEQSPRSRPAPRKLGWTSFFHTKTREIETRAISRSRADGTGDAAAAAAGGFRTKGAISKRIFFHPGSCFSRCEGPYLVKPKMVSRNSTVSGSLVPCHPDEGNATTAGKGRRAKDGRDSARRVEVDADVVPAVRPRRSFSCSFAHTTAWASKATAPGNLWRSKCVATAHEYASDHGSLQQRHMSAPSRGVNVPPAVGLFQDGPNDMANMHMFMQPSQPSGLIHHTDRATSALNSASASAAAAAAAATALPRRHEAPGSKTSSPPARLSNLPGRHVDTSRRTSPVAGLASYSMRPGQQSGSSSTSASAVVSPRRASHHGDRLYTMDGLDSDARDVNSGDDDDTDFKSDAFGSVRTAGSSRARAVETPIESVYDESPPSTGGMKKSKRSSLQENLDHTWNENSRIVEEDEMTATPIRPSAHTKQPKRERKDDTRLASDSPSPRTSRQIACDADGFSVDVDDDGFDEDWTRDDDDALLNVLLSSSKGCSRSPSHAANIHSNVQLALASIEGNSPSTYSTPGLARPERLVSNLFDWSEPPPAHDKLHPTGGAPRPQTAYSKQLGDPRGGRSVVRRGPVPTHVRSQSVPIVHEGLDDAKLSGPKYSTWGLGTKTVSEDWDEDFEFAGDNNNGPGGRENHDLFAVPESIRASQPSVRAHSGQIREFSLLVNDLKRLCRHGRELNMLNGDDKSIWKEAEGIIALASPDEDPIHDDDEDDESGSGSSLYADAFELSSSGGGGGCEGEERVFAFPIEIPDSVLERNEPAMSKTAVIRERQSPRRRSVFSPDDDIFGTSWPLADDDQLRSNRPSRPRTPERQPTKAQDVTVVVRSVVETMEQRCLKAAGESGRSTGLQNGYNATNRMHFDTNSLKALVRRAGELRDILADMIRKADQLTQTPFHTPRHEKDVNSSPAFTRVFDDPGPSPSSARRIVRNGDKSAAAAPLVEYPLTDNSSPSNMGRRVPLMTVN